MTMNHAVALVDHHHAQVQAASVKEHVHYTRQHGSKVRSEHEFFAEVSDALSGIPWVLIAGSHTAQADFRHYVKNYRPAVITKIVHWESVDHPSEGELVKLGRDYFAGQGRCPRRPVSAESRHDQDCAMGSASRHPGRPAAAHF